MQIDRSPAWPAAAGGMLRVSAAKELLEHGTASIQVVCSKIGYDEASGA